MMVGRRLRSLVEKSAGFSFDYEIRMCNDVMIFPNGGPEWDDIVHDFSKGSHCYKFAVWLWAFNDP